MGPVLVPKLFQTHIFTVELHMKQDLLSFTHWTNQDVNSLLNLAREVKTTPQAYRQSLGGKSVVALFKKPSLRTRVSFDIGINRLGGHLVYLDNQSNILDGREDINDIGANLSCWADAIVARVFSHQTLVDLAEVSNKPVINALCDLYHPCQGLADYLTLAETFDDLSKLTIAYVGDGNNVTHSLMLIGAILGCKVLSVTPKGHETNADITQQAKNIAEQNGGEIIVTNDLAALEGSNVIYTDTWLSMGDDTPLEQIKDTFMPYQVNEKMMKASGASHVMHCQPAHRDLEISSSLMDSEHSLLMQEAENRMHAQNAILLQLLKD